MAPSRSRRIGVVAAAAFSATAMAWAAGPNLPAVEFIKVGGLACLQPVVHAPGAAFTEFEAAENRWLNERYPGYKASRFERFLTLPPGGGRADRPEDATIQEDVVHLRSPRGRAITVCFEFVPWDWRLDVPDFAVYRPAPPGPALGLAIHTVNDYHSRRE